MEIDKEYNNGQTEKRKLHNIKDTYQIHTATECHTCTE